MSRKVKTADPVTWGVEISETRINSECPYLEHTIMYGGTVYCAHPAHPHSRDNRPQCACKLCPIEKNKIEKMRRRKA